MGNNRDRISGFGVGMKNVDGAPAVHGVEHRRRPLQSLPPDGQEAEVRHGRPASGIAKEFTRLVRGLALGQGTTNVQIANKTGFSESYVSRVMSGNVRRWAAVLGRRYVTTLIRNELRAVNPPQ